MKSVLGRIRRLEQRLAPSGGPQILLIAHPVCSGPDLDGDACIEIFSDCGRFSEAPSPKFDGILSASG